MTLAFASGRHQGAPSPARAGTARTPSASVGGDLVHVGGRGDVAQLFHPAHRGGGGVDLSVDAVCRLVADLPGDRGGQAGAGAGRGGAGVGQQERPGAEGAFGLSGPQAALADQRGLLVDDQPTDGRGAAERGRRADHRVAGHDRRQVFVGQPEQAEQLVVPCGGVQVGEQGPAGGGGVGDELPGQLVDQPAVGGGDHAVAGDVAAQPRQLRGGEVGVEHEPGPLGEGVLVCGQLGADALSAPVLPHDHVGQGFAGVGVPGQHGFALVGDGDHVDRHAGFGDGGAAGADHRGEQFVGVLFDPAAGQVVGAHRVFGQAEQVAVAVDDECFGAGGALVDGEDGAHRDSSFCCGGVVVSSARSTSARSGMVSPDTPRRMSR